MQVSAAAKMTSRSHNFEADSAHRGLVFAVLVALAARALPALFGFEHYGDAPVRIEAAQRWALHPHLWRGFIESFQYGPLHLTLIGALLRLVGNRVLAARALSLACGLGGVALLWLLAKRQRGPKAAFWAALGLALSPLHIQASTTGASEAVFLAFFLGALVLLLDDRVVFAALLLGGAGLVRYDGWMYVPLFTALYWYRFRDVPRALGFCALAAAPALFWMGVNARYAGDALAPLHWIDRDHRLLADQAFAFFGQVRWRLYGLAYWPIAVLGIATPLLGAFALWGSARTLLRREPGWDLVVLAWLPAAYLVFRTSVLGDFRPMARFCMVAAAISLIFAHDVLSRLRRPFVWLTVAALVATPAALAALSWHRDGSAAEWARPLSPIGSVPPGIADAAEWLRANVKPGDTILLDNVWDFLDIPLAFAVDLPETQWVRASWTDDFEERLSAHPPTLAVLLYQGKLGDWTKDEFTFRGARFCKQARFTYATIYRRCP